MYKGSLRIVCPSDTKIGSPVIFLIGEAAAAAMSSRRLLREALDRELHGAKEESKNLMRHSFNSTLINYKNMKDKYIRSSTWSFGRGYN